MLESVSLIPAPPPRHSPASGRVRGGPQCPRKGEEVPGWRVAPEVGPVCPTLQACPSPAQVFSVTCSNGPPEALGAVTAAGGPELSHLPTVQLAHEQLWVPNLFHALHGTFEFVLPRTPWGVKRQPSVFSLFSTDCHTLEICSWVPSATRE